MLILPVIHLVVVRQALSSRVPVEAGDEYLQIAHELREALRVRTHGWAQHGHVLVSEPQLAEQEEV